MEKHIPPNHKSNNSRLEKGNKPTIISNEKLSEPIPLTKTKKAKNNSLHSSKLLKVPITGKAASTNAENFQSGVINNFQQQENATDNRAQNNHPPEDAFARRNKRSIDKSEEKFDKALDSFKSLTDMVTQYYNKKSKLMSIKDNKINKPQQEQHQQQHQFQDGYEEELLKMFRKIPSYAKHGVFEILMDDMEDMLHRAEVL
ncbi:uncharacterized protein LOC122503061 [Leptopilina heterotoma]|uniref:uncharacterized protein LOC122503061 n=1 Tax=Leptopilina heterotoma TaxID=63436 RepID=UPI001CA8E1D9|nr:uncharacterized protein LOC122503061 [Leptopilina heterotoma]